MFWLTALPVTFGGHSVVVEASLCVDVGVLAVVTVDVAVVEVVVVETAKLGL